MLEAMSAGCALVLSDTEPVREFADETAVRLVDHRSPETIAEAVLATLADPADNAARRARARAAIPTTVPRELRDGRRERLFRDLAGQSAAGPLSRSTCA